MQGNRGLVHPHGRGGKEVLVHGSRCSRRIIPTHVGESRLLLCRLPSSRDHPHACGGKPLVFLLCSLHIADHPHACGGKRVVGEGNRVEMGSSPRMWGKERHFAVSSPRYTRCATENQNRMSKIRRSFRCHTRLVDDGDHRDRVQNAADDQSDSRQGIRQFRRLSRHGKT